LSYAQANRRSGEAGRRFASLQALGEAAPLGRALGLGHNALLALRNEAIACLALVDLRLDHKWEGYPPGSTLTGIAFDSEKERYARVDGNGHITVRRLADNQELVTIRDTQAPANGRQPDWRMSLRFSPDGRFLAASGNHQYGAAPMQVWNLAGPRSILKLAPGNAWENAAFDFSPDSRLFATGRPDGSILLYNTLEWKEVGRWTTERPAWCIRFDPQGRELAVAIGSSVHLVDLEGRAFSHPLDHPSTVQSICWNPLGTGLATTCASGEGYLWDTSSGQRTAIPREAQEFLLGAAFNPGGDLLATPENDGTTRLRDASTGQELVRATGLASDFSRDGRWLGLGVFGPEVGRWEVASSSEHYLLHAHSPEVVVWGLSFSPNGQWLVSSGRDGVRLWDTRLRALLSSLPDPSDSVAFGETAESLFFCGTNGFCRWSLGVTSGPALTGVQTRAPEFIPELSNPRPESVCLSADGQTMAVKLPGGARVVSLGEKTVRELCSIQYPVLSVALSPDARWLATTAADAYEAKLWDATTGQWLRDFPGIRSGNVSFTPDNRWLALATAEEYTFYQVGSWQPGLRLKREYAGYSSVSPAYDSSAPIAAIVFSARMVKIINLETGEELATLTAPQPEEIRSLRFSPAGGLLAAGTAAGDIQLWNVRQLRQRLRALDLDWEPIQAR
jgi:WD40 repeat protein